MEEQDWRKKSGAKGCGSPLEQREAPLVYRRTEKEPMHRLRSVLPSICHGL